jgi:hypothetical protein
MDEFLETTEAREAQLEKIEDRQSMLSRAWQLTDDEADMVIIDEINDELGVQWLYLRKDKEWLFNFESGGWNSIMAPDREIAIRKANQDFSTSSKINIKSFRIRTEIDYEHLMSNF